MFYSTLHSRSSGPISLGLSSDFILAPPLWDMLNWEIKLWAKESTRPSHEFHSWAGIRIVASSALHRYSIAWHLTMPYVRLWHNLTKPYVRLWHNRCGFWLPMSNLYFPVKFWCVISATGFSCFAHSNEWVKANSSVPFLLLVFVISIGDHRKMNHVVKLAVRQSQ